MNKLCFLLSVGILCIISNYSYSQLIIGTNLTPQQWVQNVLIGQGLTVSNVTYSGMSNAAGTFSGNTNIGLLSGVLLTSGDIDNAPGPNMSSSTSTDNNSPYTDSDLASTATGTLNDVCILEFDFIPQSDSIQFRYVFASEEYNEFVNTSFNDVFGFFLSGYGINGPYTNGAINIALIPNSGLPVSINNVNNGNANGPSSGPCMNCAYYVDNAQVPNSSATINYDGFTQVLTAYAGVTPCKTYHIKLCIADVSDPNYDSGVFLEANSFSSATISTTTTYVNPANPNMVAPIAVEGCRKAEITFKMPTARVDSQFVKIKDILIGSAIYNTDYTLDNYNPIDSTVLILPYHFQGTLTIDPLYDGIPEGIETMGINFRTSLCTDSIDTTLMFQIYDYEYITMTAKNDTAVCESDVQLWVNAVGGAPPYSAQWSPIQTLNDPNSLTPIASPFQTTTYQVVLKDSTRCSVKSDSIKVTYNKIPMISFKPSEFSACDSLTVQFTNNTSPSNQSYLWKFGDGDSSILENPIHTYYYNEVVPSYNVTMTALSPEGCSSTYTVPGLITLHPSPVAAFVAVPDSTSTADSIIVFSNNSSLAATSFFWMFGDKNNSSSTELHPTFMYDDPGEYTVWLYVMSPYGCKDSTSAIVTVTQELDYELTFPNVITPNGDGKNDVLKITNLENFTSSELLVYDRWGKKIFEASPYQNNWDAGNAADGVYYYIITYKKKKNLLKYDGTLTILR